MKYLQIFERNLSKVIRKKDLRHRFRLSPLLVPSQDYLLVPSVSTNLYFFMSRVEVPHRIHTHIHSLILFYLYIRLFLNWKHVFLVLILPVLKAPSVESYFLC